MSLEWSDKYSVNIGAMDEQHKKLIGMVNGLDEAMRKGKGREVVGRVLDGLVEYTKVHFADEERLMKENDYPEYGGHKQKHDDLTRQVLKLQSDYRENNISITIKVMNFLTDWLTNHIVGTDKQYGVFLNGKGMK